VIEGEERVGELADGQGRLGEEVEGAACYYAGREEGRGVSMQGRPEALESPLLRTLCVVLRVLWRVRAIMSGQLLFSSLLL